jgi:hypothetical protein
VKRFSALLVAACIVMFHVTAAAQNESPEAARAQASVRFKRGVELFQDEAYRAALIEFERAYELSPDYRLLYNIGGCKLQLQDFLGAAQAYDEYLSEGGSAIPRDRREEVEPVLRSLQARVGRITIKVNRDGAEVFIDDIKVGIAPVTNTISVNVGRHRVAARTEDGANDAKIVDVAGDEIADVALTLAPPRKDTPIARERRSQLMRLSALTGWSVGGAMLVGSIITGVLAKNADGDLDALFKRVDVAPKKVADQRSSIKTLAVTTDALMIGGAAFAIAGTVLWLVDRRARRKDERENEIKTAARPVDFQVGLGTASVLAHF